MSRVQIHRVKKSKFIFENTKLEKALAVGYVFFFRTRLFYILSVF
ncbi:hypothetical protein LEP1GSC073_1421 [Leptospira noguchii str. Cascata]|uniref:Uncharacterized protein n=1 Tax=Leptospira noguchii serovar Autumnalis str. ZUN142 TaxID=1085540 RepID=M6UHF2_9LEPT|nr:hypothetical protein LEP1GSC186_0432 [Leptospira noguchii serovar Autumnalis str. ZUN142]EMS82726.1 hypothetical protein LEP1GSC073_1421 [Leptospira noguchii str. Cascata]